MKIGIFSNQAFCFILGAALERGRRHEKYVALLFAGICLYRVIGASRRCRLLWNCQL